MVVDRRPVTFGSLPGVTYWQRRLEEECMRARRHGRDFVAVLMTLASDGTLNGEPFPPAEGIMAIAADTLRRALRASDVVCGLTPVRFGMLLVETPLGDAHFVIARLTRLVERDVARRLPAAEPPIIKIGLAPYQPECDSPQALAAALELSLATNSGPEQK